MIRFGLTFSLLLAAAGISAQDETRTIVPSRAPERKALVIGNARYGDHPLANPANDARDIGQALNGLGFQVDLLTDLTKEQLQSATSSFAQSLGYGDTAVFYYSGHGIQIDAENYLIPIEFHATNEREAQGRAVAFSAIKNAMEKRPARLSLMILDACRNNPFAGSTLDIKGMAPVEAGLGAYIVFAASPGQTARDNPSGRNGLLATYLLQALKLPLSISEMFRRVRQEVYVASQKTQLPYLHDQVLGDFFFRPPASPASTPPIAVTTDTSGTLFEKAKALYHEGRCGEALPIFEGLVRQQPADPYLRNAIGLCLVCMQMRSPALDHFSRAIQLKPDYASAYFNRAQLFLQSGQFELAIDDFDWTLEQEPRNSIVYWRRGTAKFGLRRYEDAQRDFTQSIECDRSSPYGYHGRGRVLFQLGKYRDALADFDAALARKRDYTPALDDRARTRGRLAPAR